MEGADQALALCVIVLCGSLIALSLILLVEILRRLSGFGFVENATRIPMVVYVMLGGVIFGSVDYAAGSPVHTHMNEISHDVLATIFFPILMAQELLFINIHSLRPVFIQTALLTFLSLPISAALTTYTVKYLLFKDWSPAQAWNFASAISTTDFTAILPILQKYDSLSHLGMLFKGETLFNDLISYTMSCFFIGYEQDATILSREMIKLVAWTFMGAISLGLLIGFLSNFFILKLTRSRFVISLVYLQFPHAVFILAESLEMSGLAAVCFFSIATSTGNFEHGSIIEELEMIMKFFKDICNYALFFWAGTVIFWSMVRMNLKVLAFTSLKFTLVFPIITLSRLISLGAVACIFRKLNPEYNVDYIFAQTWGSLRSAVSLLMFAGTRASLQHNPAEQKYVDEFGILVVLTVAATHTIQAPTFKWFLTKLNMIEDDHLGGIDFWAGVFESAKEEDESRETKSVDFEFFDDQHAPNDDNEVRSPSSGEYGESAILMFSV